MSDPHTPTLYDQIGGEAGVRRLTRRFYELMDLLPDAAACRAIHPPSLAGSEQKLYEYLTGWMGGPPLFTDKYGAPMLRRRHFSARIGGPERDGWLLCFRQAVTETVAPPVAAIFMGQIEALADHMQNQ